MQSQTLDINQVSQALEARDFSFLRSAFQELEVADIGELLTDFELDQVVVLFRLVEKERRAELFGYLPFELQEQLLDELPDVVVSSILNNMEAVDRTKLLEDLNFLIRDKIIKKMTQEERVIARQLLSYPENSVGRLMNPEFLALRPEMKAHEAIEHIRWRGADYAESALHNMFVIDATGRYLGDVSLAQLVLQPLQPIFELMTPSTAVLHSNADREFAVDHFRKYDRHFAPVVNENNVVVGIVTADDVFDVAEEEATQDIQQFGGQAILEESYFATSLMELIRKRGGWLCLLFVGEFFATDALQGYEKTIESMKYLVFFLPLIISSGGNSGTQAASLIIRGFAVREMDLTDWFRVLRRELATGIGLGLTLGAIGYFFVIAKGHPQEAGVIVATSVLGVVIFGATLGAMMPFLLKRMKLDPAVSSSPFIACVVDCVGIVIYFSVAGAVMNYIKLTP